MFVLQSRFSIALGRKDPHRNRRGPKHDLFNLWVFCVGWKSRNLIDCRAHVVEDFLDIGNIVIQFQNHIAEILSTHGSHLLDAIQIGYGRLNFLTDTFFRFLRRRTRKRDGHEHNLKRKVREHFSAHDDHADRADQHGCDQKRIHGGGVFDRPANDRLHNFLLDVFLNLRRLLSQQTVS